MSKNSDHNAAHAAAEQDQAKASQSKEKMNNPDILKIFYKVWSGLSKYLKS